MKKCIILANGKSPRKSDIVFLNKKGYKFLICADGGGNTTAKLDLVPNIIIGDLDSLTKENQKYFSNKCEIKKITSQNDTDVEKCIKYAIKKGYNEVILLGATGDRLDHSFCNLGIVLKYHDEILIKIIHEKSLLLAHHSDVIINTIPNETISLYGIDDKTKITSSGLKYALKNNSLPFGKKESTSNVATSNKVTLNIKNGKIFVVRDYETMRKNDLI